MHVHGRMDQTVCAVSLVRDSADALPSFVVSHGYPSLWRAPAIHRPCQTVCVVSVVRRSGDALPNLIVSHRCPSPQGQPSAVKAWGKPQDQTVCKETLVHGSEDAPAIFSTSHGRPHRNEHPWPCRAADCLHGNLCSRIEGRPCYIQCFPRASLTVVTSIQRPRKQTRRFARLDLHVSCESSFPHIGRGVVD